MFLLGRGYSTRFGLLAVLFWTECYSTG